MSETTSHDLSAEHVDVVVIGGGAAGLSAALMLARSRRSVLVVDAGEPRNAPAGHVHGYLGREGTPPLELLEIGRSEVRSYGGQVRAGRVAGVSGVRGDFRVELESGDEDKAREVVHARRVVLATGLVDVLPDLEGIHARWGRDVLHCPYCHGWEVQDQRIGVIAMALMPTHQAQLFRQLSDRVTLLLHGAVLDDDQRAGLEARGIEVVEGDLAAVEVEDDRLTGVRLADGRVVALEALVVPPQFEARADLAEKLGAAMTELPFGRHVAVDPVGLSSVPGLWVAGNAANPMAQVLMSAAQGGLTGAAVNGDLIEEEIATATAASTSTAATARSASPSAAARAYRLSVPNVSQAESIPWA